MQWGQNWVVTTSMKKGSQGERSTRQGPTLLHYLLSNALLWVHHTCMNTQPSLLKSSTNHKVINQVISCCPIFNALLLEGSTPTCDKLINI